MEIFFILSYALFFSLLISILPYFKKKDIPIKWLIIIYLLKVVAGLAYNQFHILGDAGYRAKDAQHILNALGEHPISVLKFLLLPESMWDSFELQPYLSQFSYPNGFHSEYTLIRVYVVGMLITGGYFNGVIPIIAFLVLVANLNYYNLFRTTFVEIPPFLLLLILSLTPSLTFFTAGLYKEAFIYMAIGLILTNIWGLMNDRGTWKQVVYIGLGLYLLALFRWLDLILYLPVFFAYILLHKATRNVGLKYLGILLSLAIFGLFLDFLIDRVDLFQILYDRKTITLGGNARSSFATPDWRGSGLFLFLYLPNAFFNALFRPFIWNAETLFQLVGGIETLFLFLFLVVCLLNRKKHLKMTPLLGFLLFASISRLCFVGLFIENSGTIIRHRTEVLTFIILFLFAYLLDIKRISQKLNYLKNGSYK